MLEARYEIAAADVQGALARQQLTLAKGDAVLIHTGWGRLWNQDVTRYGGPAPGIGISAATWLASQDVLLIGSDTSSVEASPNPDQTLDLPVHQEFALIVEPLKIRGGTGSTVAPIAVR